MCGLVGILAGNRQKRRVKDIEALTDVFTMMLLLSEHRGPHATGVAWVKHDGSMRVAKEPLPARQFVQSGAYIDWLLGVDREITYLMGHTRWPSYGSVMNPANNHPLVVPVPALDQPGAAGPSVDRMRSAMGSLAVTHNGSLRAWERHFTRLQLPRTTQVDSELLARIAQRHAGATGLALDAILADLSPLEGSMSLALVATTRPEEIILLKGNMPLEVCIQPRARILAYASEARILDRALAGGAGWETVPLAHGEGLVVNTLVLTAHRLPVDAVGDAESALKQLSVQTYDILLTDYELPMITGSELIHRVRQCWPSIRIVLMSNHTHIHELAAQLGVDAYFTKMNATELPHILQAVMGHKTP